MGRDRHHLARLGHDVAVGRDKGHGALGDEEALVVEAVPVHRGARRPSRQLQQHAPNAAVRQTAVLEDPDGRGPDLHFFAVFARAVLYGYGAAERHFGIFGG